MNLRRMLKTQMERGNGQIEIIPIPQDKRTTMTNLKKLDCLLSFESQRNRMIECRSFVFASNQH